MYQDCSSRHDLSEKKNKGRQGQGFISPIYLHKKLLSLVRNHWTYFSITTEFLLLWPFSKFVQAIMIHKKKCRKGERGLFLQYIYI